jgi:hypothetical protein
MPIQSPALVLHLSRRFSGITVQIQPKEWSVDGKSQ